MNNPVKLAALLMVTFIATGAVIYQLMNRRPIRTAVILPPSGATVAAPVAAPPARPTETAGVNSASPLPQTISASPVDQRNRVNIPQAGWARNPFLTPEEIDRLNHPELPVVEAPPPKASPELPQLPAYSLTGIITGGKAGNWAIIDSRTMRAGDHIGTETIKQVTDRSVILDHQGHTRELPLKGIEETAAAAPAKEAKP